MDIETLLPIQDWKKDRIMQPDKNSRLVSPRNTVSELGHSQTSSDKEKIASAIKAMESYLRSKGTHLKFVLTDKQKMQVEIIEEDTKKLIRKIPSDEMLNLAEAIEKMTGVFMDGRV